ncbi:MAG TPA: aminotransferase class V-fold PLP-dependent enzyme [Longimicrobiales bacterium]
MAGAAAAAALPAVLRAGPAAGAAGPPLAGGQEDEAYWRRVRDRFLIPAGRIYLNVGTLGPQPLPVVEAVERCTRQVAETYPPGVAWDRLKSRLGQLLDGDPDGFVFPRNTTEAMSWVANGLELAAGDEVLTTDHEHIGGLCCWQALAARRGIRLRVVQLPATDGNPEEVIRRVRAALSPRTRVLSISHVLFTNGAIMPIRELVALCRGRGIISVVDGAHPPGLIRLSLRTLDPDFYASSLHKWLLAPQGTGLLYIPEDWRTRLWPTVVSGEWDDLSLGAHRLNHIGTIDESRLAGLEAALDFHEAIGPDRVERRIRALRRRLAERLAALPHVRITSPARDSQVAGMVSFRIEGVDALEAQRRLAQDANVRSRVIGEYGYGWLRLSPHIYNTPEELDRVVDLLAAMR